MEPFDEKDMGQRALKVLRAWNAGNEDNLPIAMHEAKQIIEEDGDADRLVADLITVAGFLLVNLEQRGQPPAVTMALTEAFLESGRDDA
ncbi:hypothetical protein [Egicoccus sp. AB-alg6-2]|uniref:hypothetical protein n=1 Tax=Egicoccus sp. AB-alg6-2 TaxID=3242692 RepID=UPI00359E1620